MLVTITGFGSITRTRSGTIHDSTHRSRLAYYNTTGIPVEGKVLPCTKIAGQVRFNGVGGFDAHHPLRMLNSVFVCEEPCVWRDQNKVLFKSILHAPERPDYLLVVARSWELGHLQVGTSSWRSEDTFLISFSEMDAAQEIMLLMRPGAWLRSSLGYYRLQPFTTWWWSARLQLVSSVEYEMATGEPGLSAKTDCSIPPK